MTSDRAKALVLAVLLGPFALAAQAQEYPPKPVRYLVAFSAGLATVAESGCPEYESGNWYGLLVPAKTPRETVMKIRNLTVQALQRPDTKKRLESLAHVIMGNRPDEFASFIGSEIEQTAKILRQTGVPPR